MSDRYFDDFEVGARFTTPGVTLTESLIIDFALRFDPQPFHIDVEAAKGSNYGGLIDVQSKPGEGTTFSVYLPLAA